LNDSVGRLEFARQLYNVLHVKVEDQEDKDARNATTELRNAILKYPEMLLLYAPPPPITLGSPKSVLAQVTVTVTDQTEGVEVQQTTQISEHVAMR
jgi:hypothetical protein